MSTTTFSEPGSKVDWGWLRPVLIFAPFAMFSIDLGFFKFLSMTFDGAIVMTLVTTALWFGLPSLAAISKSDTLTQLGHKR